METRHFFSLHKSATNQKFLYPLENKQTNITKQIKKQNQPSNFTQYPLAQCTVLVTEMKTQTTLLRVRMQTFHLFLPSALRAAS